MKAIRLLKFQMPDYGIITFCPTANAPGFTHEVFFKPLGCEYSTRAGWLADVAKPNASNAVFFTRVACAMLDQMPHKHYYADQRIDPPVQNRGKQTGK